MTLATCCPLVHHVGFPSLNLCIAGPSRPLPSPQEPLRYPGPLLVEGVVWGVWVPRADV